MGKLILVRHGKSLWNVENKFTGWTDIELAPQGILEARKAGQLLQQNSMEPSICFSSYLKRAIRTNWIILDTAGMMHIDCLYSWRLNERHYGAWQGKNKDEIKSEVAEELFWKIRRGYDTPPPALESDDKQHPRFDDKYKHINSDYLPLSESLKDTRKRVVAYFFECIAPQLVQNKTVLVTAHGNSIRALMSQMGKIPAMEVSKIEVPTGIPYVYEFDDNLNLKNKYIMS